MQLQARGIWRLGFGHQLVEVPGGEIAVEGFGAAQVNFVLREIVGDALELIAALAAADAAAAQLIEGINEVREKVDALADERQLKGERFAGVNEFAFVERRQQHERMRQIGGGDVGIGAAVLRGFKNIRIRTLVAELAALGALSGRQDAADFFHDMPKPAAEGGAFVFGQMQALLRREVKGEGGEGELEVLQGGGEVGHGQFSVISDQVWVSSSRKLKVVDQTQKPEIGLIELLPIADYSGYWLIYYYPGSLFKFILDLFIKPREYRGILRTMSEYFVLKLSGALRQDLVRYNFL